MCQIQRTIIAIIFLMKKITFKSKFNDSKYFIFFYKFFLNLLLSNHVNISLFLFKYFLISNIDLC